MDPGPPSLCYVYKVFSLQRVINLAQLEVEFLSWDPVQGYSH